MYHKHPFPCILPLASSERIRHGPRRMAATYAVGDLHGCFDSLQALLEQLPLRRKRDRLWLTGDLVNRGPKSLETLRWARATSRAMGERFRAVLGNHDLHLLAAAHGVGKPRSGDTFDAILSAPDRDKLVRWLSRLPFLHREDGWLLVHAGLLPQWTPDKAEAQAERLARAFRGPWRNRLLARDFDGRGLTAAEVKKLHKRRRALAALTRLRTCTRDGEPCHFTGPPSEAPRGCLPWFAVPGRRSAGANVVFGHWAALGFHRQEGALALDSGCAWGGALTAVRLEDGKVYQQKALEGVERRA